jgi:hypothetical protein
MAEIDQNKQKTFADHKCRDTGRYEFTELPQDPVLFRVLEYQTSVREERKKNSRYPLKDLRYGIYDQVRTARRILGR